MYTTCICTIIFRIADPLRRPITCTCSMFSVKVGFVEINFTCIVLLVGCLTYLALTYSTCTCTCSTEVYHWPQMILYMCFYVQVGNLVKAQEYFTLVQNAANEDQAKQALVKSNEYVLWHACECSRGFLKKYPTLGNNTCTIGWHWALHVHVGYIYNVHVD